MGDGMGGDDRREERREARRLEELRAEVQRQTAAPTKMIPVAASTPVAPTDMKHGLTSTRPKLSILPLVGLVYGTRGLEYGGDKYRRGNYYAPPPPGVEPIDRLLGYIDAAQRHLAKTAEALNRVKGLGGDAAAAAACVDNEASGGFPPSMIPHLAHAIASLLIGVSVGVDDGLLPADPGTPWKALIAAAKDGNVNPLSQKDDPAAERARVDALARRQP